MTVVDKLNYLLETKRQIKEKLIEKGVSIENTDSFRSYANKIEQLGNISNCLTENAIDDMEKIFKKMFKVLPKDVCSFLNTNTATATNMWNMFSECVNLTELDLSGLDTSNVTNMNTMFYNCISLRKLDLSNFETSNVTDMGYMFKSCSNLTELNLSNFDTSNVTNMTEMFYNCENLVTINGILDFNNASKTNAFIMGCVNLETIYIKNFNTPRNNNFSDCVKLSHESLVYWINNLKQSGTVKTITFGSVNLAKLTEEEIAVATEKNWTLS